MNVVGVSRRHVNEKSEAFSSVQIFTRYLMILLSVNRTTEQDIASICVLWMRPLSIPKDERSILVSNSLVFHLRASTICLSTSVSKYIVLILDNLDCGHGVSRSLRHEMCGRRYSSSVPHWVMILNASRPDPRSDFPVITMRRSSSRMRRSFQTSHTRSFRRAISRYSPSLMCARCSSSPGVSSDKSSSGIPGDGGAGTEVGSADRPPNKSRTFDQKLIVTLSARDSKPRSILPVGGPRFAGARSGYPLSSHMRVSTCETLYQPLSQ